MNMDSPSYFYLFLITHYVPLQPNKHWPGALMRHGQTFYIFKNNARICNPSAAVPG